MSKLYDALQDQLKTEHKKEAEDCIKIYNVLKAISREKYGEEHVRSFRLECPNYYYACWELS